jgi:hypothetical protein
MTRYIVHYAPGSFFSSGLVSTGFFVVSLRNMMKYSGYGIRARKRLRILLRSFFHNLMAVELRRSRPYKFHTVVLAPKVFRRTFEFANSILMRLP